MLDEKRFTLELLRSFRAINAKAWFENKHSQYGESINLTQFFSGKVKAFSASIELVEVYIYE